MDDDIQEQAERVDKNMPLAARNLLARIEALCVEPSAPFMDGPPLPPTLV
jgi:hypothetical protein